jgi:hypothetical protein
MAGGNYAINNCHNKKEVGTALLYLFRGLVSLNSTAPASPGTCDKSG